VGAIIGKKDTYKRNKSGTLRKINRNGKNGSLGLARTLALLPTQTASDEKGGRAKDTPRKGAKKSNVRDVLNEVYGQTGITTYPNPSYVEEMMGFPKGHTDLEH
jgi:hypothetical protein